jgi:alkylation response protein AidB-like acyl-CoA dehydrogenase
MANLAVDERDQKFVLYELFNADKLCESPKYSDFSVDMFNMIISEAQKFSTEEMLPILAETDREGCKLENGNVRVPKAYQRLYKLYREGGWIGMNKKPEDGGQGLPNIITAAAKEWFLHNFAFMIYTGISEGSMHLIEVYGSEAQKKRYMEKMMTGEWMGTMCLTEPSAGTDVGNLKTKAFRKPDGTYRIQGTKLFISSGDHDLTENIIHFVLARIEGAPPGTGGLSIFIVPKYVVNEDGSLGRRNDYSIGSIEEKLGLHGSSTCLMNFGDNNECFAELLGEERQGIKIMFQLMIEARIGVGLQGLAGSSIAYLHALQYAKDRIQGPNFLEWGNPEAPRVAIIEHPDVRRMLLWMKAHVEGMRALMYYLTWCVDKCETLTDPAEQEKYLGILEVLTPICKAFNSDTGFKITEQAMQVYGGFGYCMEYPVEQFMRDMKITSIYEGANGIQALDLVGRKLGRKKGTSFLHLLGEMNAIVAKYKDQALLKDIANDVQAALNMLSDTGMFFANSAMAGKFLIPIANAYPFLMTMGKIILACLLLWEAGVAREKLDVICKGKSVDPADLAKVKELAKDHADAAFYSGKLSSARYFIKHVLPEAESAVKSIKSEDLSMIEIPNEGF